MPYIKQGSRFMIDQEVESLAGQIDNEGDLNYAIFKLLLSMTEEWGKNYATLNRIKGVMSCCSDEFTRRVINPYEDEKIEENGDII